MLPVFFDYKSLKIKVEPGKISGEDKWQDFLIEASFLGKTLRFKFCFSQIAGRFVFAAQTVELLQYEPDFWNKVFNALDIDTTYDRQMEIYEEWKEERKNKGL